MGARPSQFKRGGGILNGVDLTITGYQYSDEFNGEPFKPGKIKDAKTGKLIDKPHSLNVLLSVRVDGADEDTTQTLKAAGDFDAWEVSEDGLDVTPVEDSQQFNAKAAFPKFIASLVRPTDGEDGFPEERLPEDTFNFSAIIGTRVRTVQQVDVQRTKEFGKKVDKKGREWDRTDLVVEHVYSLPGTEVQPVKTASKSAVKSATKPAASTVKAAGGKPNGKIAKPDISEKSVEYLKTILAANKGSINKNKMSMPILKLAAKNGETDIRDDVRTWLFNDENLNSVEGIVYDQESGEIATA